MYYIFVRYALFCFSVFLCQVSSVMNWIHYYYCSLRHYPLSAVNFNLTTSIPIRHRMHCTECGKFKIFDSFQIELLKRMKLIRWKEWNRMASFFIQNHNKAILFDFTRAHAHQHENKGITKYNFLNLDPLKWQSIWFYYRF